MPGDTNQAFVPTGWLLYLSDDAAKTVQRNMGRYVWQAFPFPIAAKEGWKIATWVHAEHCAGSPHPKLLSAGANFLKPPKASSCPCAGMKGQRAKGHTCRGLSQTLHRKPQRETATTQERVAHWVYLGSPRCTVVTPVGVLFLWHLWRALRRAIWVIWVIIPGRRKL